MQPASYFSPFFYDGIDVNILPEQSKTKRIQYITGYNTYTLSLGIMFGSKKHN